MNCCGETLRVTRLIFNANGNYKRVEFGLCQECGKPQTLVYSMNKTGRDREKRFIGDTAVKEFRRYQRLKYSIKQGSKINQNVYYGDFRKTRKRDKNGIPVYLQLKKNFNGDYIVLNEIQTVIHSG